MFQTIKRFLIPHHTNNHRAKILHNSSLVAIIAVFLFISLFALVIKNTHPEVLGVSYSISQHELVSLINQQRQNNGLGPLTGNSLLDDAARRKASDMLSKNYWAHFSPDGSSSPWTFIKDSGYPYSFAGENLAKGFTDAGSIVAAWMESPSHRDNILSNKYKEVGFAIVPGTLEGEETVLVVQMFGARNTDSLAQASPKAAQIAGQEVQASPTPAEVKIAGVDNIPSSSAKGDSEMAVAKPLVDTKSTAKAITTVALSFLIFVLVMDVVIVEKRKIPRLVGHNLDHIMLIMLFLLFIVLSSTGSTL